LKLIPLEELLAKMSVDLSPEDKEAQRTSFVYGNLTISNPATTKVFVANVAKKPRWPTRILKRAILRILMFVSGYTGLYWQAKIPFLRSTVWGNGTFY